MSFIAPGMLLWFLPILAGIIVLYMLRMRRTDVQVPATFLWPQLTSEVRANAFFQKLRWNILMAVQILAAALLILGLARPQIRRQGVNGQTTVVVVDASASMSAREGNRTRLEIARDQAEQIVQALKAGDQVSVIESGPVPRVAAPLSGDIGRLRQAVQSIRPTDAASDMGEALRLAVSLVSKREQARIVVLSDGVFPKVENLSAGKAEIVYSQIGQAFENLSIDALGCSSGQAFVGVKNHGPDTKSTTVRVFADGTLINSFRLDIRPHQTAGQVSGIPTTAKLVEARIDSPDALAADNYAASLAGDTGGIKVLVVGPSDFFLERALTVDPRTTVDRTTELPEAARKGAYDIVVFNGTREQEVRAKGVIVIRSGAAKNPAAQPLSQHPISEGVSFDGVYIEGATRLDLPKGAEVLFGSENSPLIAAQEGMPRKVFIGFKLADSDFPLSVSFPIFVGNCLDWLTPAAGGDGPLVVGAGRPFTVRTPDDKPIEVRHLETKQATDVTRHDKLAVIRETTLVGPYEVNNRKVVATLADHDESAIAPQASLRLAGTPTKASDSVFVLSDLWRYALGLVLLVLAAEWWLFVRKS